MLTRVASDKERVVRVCRCGGPVWALSLHLSAIHSQLQAVLDLVCTDFVPLSITQTACCIRLIDSREPACTIVNVKHHLKSTVWTSASFQNSSVGFVCLFCFQSIWFDCMHQRLCGLPSPWDLGFITELNTSGNVQN